MIIWVLIFFVILFFLFQRPSGYTASLTSTMVDLGSVGKYRWTSINKYNVALSQDGQIMKLNSTGNFSSQTTLPSSGIWIAINDNGIALRKDGYVYLIDNNTLRITTGNGINDARIGGDPSNIASGTFAINNNNITIGLSTAGTNGSKNYSYVLDSEGTQTSGPNYIDDSGQHYLSINDNNIAVSQEGHAIALRSNGTVLNGPINLGINNWSCINNNNIAVSQDGYSVVLNPDGTVLNGPINLGINNLSGINNNNIAVSLDGQAVLLNPDGTINSGPININPSYRINDNNIIVGPNQYVTLITPPPIDCQVSDWGDFGACSASCGGGTQTRTRTIVTPAAFGGSCPVLSETQNCNIQACAIDCEVSDWGDFGACSKTCGGGTQTRTRTVVTSPANGGSSCPALTESQPCNTQACAMTPAPSPVSVDCEVSDWGDFGACSASCGGGTQTRTRTIVTQAANGGSSCPALTETLPCNTQPCPIAQEPNYAGLFVMMALAPLVYIASMPGATEIFPQRL